MGRRGIARTRGRLTCFRSRASKQVGSNHNTRAALVFPSTPTPPTITPSPSRLPLLLLHSPSCGRVESVLPSSRATPKRPSRSLSPPALPSLPVRGPCLTRRSPSDPLGPASRSPRESHSATRRTWVLLLCCLPARRARVELPRSVGSSCWVRGASRC